MKQIIDKNETNEYEENKKLTWYEKIYVYFKNYINIITWN